MTALARIAGLVITAICISAFYSGLALGAQNPYVVIDTADGTIIEARDENRRWYPASLTKLMTAYVTMVAIANREIAIGSPVRMSARAARMPASRMGYKPGTILRVDTALKILIVKSANDVSIALAEAVAGSVENFAARMNKTAKSLGMSDSNFVNPNGLHAPNQFTTARDLAILSRRLFLDFPQFADWFSIPAIKTSKKTHYSYNLLLERFRGANGMKTGFICASGYNMVASATRQGRQLIAVILGASSQIDRAVQAAKVLTTAFDKPEKIAGNILSPRKVSTNPPISMRNILCTQEARKQRYEPAAGKAVIKSVYLQPRKITRKPVLVTTGGVDGSPGKYSISISQQPRFRVPVPSPRPEIFRKPAIGIIEQPASSLRGSIPLPVKRPQF